MNATREKIRRIIQDMHRDGLYSPHLARLRELANDDGYWRPEEIPTRPEPSDAPTPPTGYYRPDYPLPAPSRLPVETFRTPAPLRQYRDWPPAAKNIIALLTLIGVVRELGIIELAQKLLK